MHSFVLAFDLCPLLLLPELLLDVLDRPAVLLALCGHHAEAAAAVAEEFVEEEEVEEEAVFIEFSETPVEEFLDEEEVVEEEIIEAETY